MRFRRPGTGGLPYYWRPLGNALAGFAELKPGMLMPFEHAVYRIIETKYIEEHGDRPCVVVVRPVGVTADDPRSRDHDLSLGAEKYHVWYVYPDGHYPICATCYEPLPCREQMAEKYSAEQAARFERYTIAGVCPACQEPVSQRQKSLTWEDNVVVPGGPPVTFHLRASCWGSAQSYELDWAAADPDRRPLRLTCKGHLSEHYDGTWSCSKLDECAGEMAQHRSYERHYPGHSTCFCVAGELTT